MTRAILALAATIAEAALWLTWLFILAALMASMLIVMRPVSRAQTPTPPPSLTPVLIPPIACGIPGWPPCFPYRVYMPVIERVK